MRKAGLFLSLVCLFLSALLLSVEICAKDAELFYDIQKRIGLLDGAKERGSDFVMDLDREITAYLAGESDDIKGIGGKALMHMGDVRALLDRVLPLSVASAIAGAVLFFISRKQRFTGAAAVFIACLLLGAVAYPILRQINFHEAFIWFHETAFENDLWLLDPIEEMLIRILPEAFFNVIAMEILKKSVLYWLIAGAAILATIAIRNGRNGYDILRKSAKKGAGD